MPRRSLTAPRVVGRTRLSCRKRQRDTQRCRQYYAVGGPMGLPLITSQITIEGNGATIARQGNAPAFGLIAVKQFSGDLTLRSLTLSGGSSWFVFGGVARSNLRYARVSRTAPSQAIRPSRTAVAYLICTALSPSKTAPSRAIRPAGGGGVSNYGGTVAITNSTISGNTANRAVGAYITRSDTDGAAVASRSLTAPSRAIAPIRAVAYLTSGCLRSFGDACNSSLSTIA